MNKNDSNISDELVHEKEKFKAISDELDQTFAEMSGYQILNQNSRPKKKKKNIAALFCFLYNFHGPFFGPPYFQIYPKISGTPLFPSSTKSLQSRQFQVDDVILSKSFTKEKFFAFPRNFFHSCQFDFFKTLSWKILERVQIIDFSQP